MKPSLLLLITALTVQADWPQYRGVGGRGLGSGNPPTHWNVESGENLLWKVAVPGLGHSSPIVAGERVFLSTAISSSGRQSLKVGMYGSGDSPEEAGDWQWDLLCLDRATGKLLWQRNAHRGKPQQKRHTKASHANSTPAISGDRVVTMFGSEGFYCYDLAGELQWKADLGLLHAGPYNAPELEWGFASSPVIHAGQVIMQCDVLNGGFIAILDLQTGKEVRRIRRSQEVTTWSTPAIWQTAERTQIICNGYRQIGSYDLATGAEIWQLRGGGDIPVPTPFIAGGLAYICNSHGRMSPIYAISATAKGDITPKSEQRPPAGITWWKARGGSYIPTPIVLGEELYVAGGRGVLTCYDATTGELQYKQRVGKSASYSASPVAAAGRLYLTAETGAINVIATPEFRLIASNDMNETCMATPAIDDGQLFIRTRSHLYCVGEKKTP